MNKQIILAAVASTAAAQAATPEECKDAFVGQIEANLKTLKGQLATAEAAQKGLDTALGTAAAKGTAWAAYAKAKGEREAHEALMATYIANHTTAKKAETDNSASENAANVAKGAEQGKVDALNVKIGTNAALGTYAASAKGMLATKDAAIGTQTAEVATLDTQVTQHTTE